MRKLILFLATVGITTILASKLVTSTVDMGSVSEYLVTLAILVGAFFGWKYVFKV